MPSNCSGDAVEPSDLGEIKSVERMSAATNASMDDAILRVADWTADTAAVMIVATSGFKVRFDIGKLLICQIEISVGLIALPITK